MTVTIKLPITMSPEDAQIIKDLQRQQNCVTRSALKAANAGVSEKEMRAKFKSLNNIPDIDSWFAQCAIGDGHAMSKADKALDGVIRTFGTKSGLLARSENKITKEEWKESRLMPLYVIGEAGKDGNRKFKFDIFNSNTIIFKKCRGTKITLFLPKLKKNVREQLVNLECHMNERLVPVTIRLTSTHICIAYDETCVSKIEKQKLRLDRRLGIDLNPNYVGCSIQTDKGIILDTKMFVLKELTKKSGLPSSDPKSKHMHHKLNHETIEIAKQVIAFAKSRHVGIICVEDLKFKQGDAGRGKEFNRKNNNVWKKGLFVRVLLKYASLEGIKVIRVNCAYSSTVGNILNSKFPDPIAASIEIGRRGPGIAFYPPIISKEDLSNLWKEATDWTYETWIDLHKILKKNPKVKYRVPIQKEMFFRKMCSHKSNVSYS